MTPPCAALNGSEPEEARPAAVSFCVTTLKKRADFLRAARAPRVATPAFILQARRRAAGEAETMRVGFTCSKKVGNAVARNRAKRRLRAIARHVLPKQGQCDTDYVLIGRAGATANRPLDLLIGDLEKALATLHGRRT